MKSYWLNSIKYKYPKLNEDIETDICIIGGGITGIQIAYYLNQYKIRNVVLEKDRIGSSTSGGSTGKITSQHGLIYKYLIDSKGKEFAKKYYEANEMAIKNIKNIIEKEELECDFEIQSSYVFTERIEELQKIRDEISAIKEIGGKAEFIESNQLKIPLKILGAIEFQNQAQFNIYKYIKELANVCAKKQTKIYENSKVIKLEKIENNYNLILENGAIVKAKYIVIATKYPIINFPGYYFLKMYQSTSNCIVIDPKDELFNGMYINSENPTISIRTIKDNQERLILIAGFDHKTGAKIDLKNSYSYLENIAKKMYPKCEVKYRWNTEDCISLDKIAYIGEFSNVMPKVYVATGFKKWGITTSDIAAQIITDNILDKQNEYEDIFKATRLEPIKNIKEVGNVLKESLNSLVVNKLKSPKESIEQIENGQGGIVKIKGEKVGIYKDEQGKIFKVKPVCAHLGCELSWNNLDKTWDCPCHGSRYNYKGELIYGPSVKSLKKDESN